MEISLENLHVDYLGLKGLNTTIDVGYKCLRIDFKIHQKKSSEFIDP